MGEKITRYVCWFCILFHAGLAIIGWTASEAAPPPGYTNIAICKHRPLPLANITDSPDHDLTVFVRDGRVVARLRVCASCRLVYFEQTGR